MRSPNYQFSIIDCQLLYLFCRLADGVEEGAQAIDLGGMGGGDVVRLATVGAEVVELGLEAVAGLDDGAPRDDGLAVGGLDVLPAGGAHLKAAVGGHAEGKGAVSRVVPQPGGEGAAAVGSLPIGHGDAYKLGEGGQRVNL